MQSGILSFIPFFCLSLVPYLLIFISLLVVICTFQSVQFHSSPFHSVFSFNKRDFHANFNLHFNRQPAAVGLHKSGIKPGKNDWIWFANLLDMLQSSRFPFSADVSTNHSFFNSSCFLRSNLSSLAYSPSHSFSVCKFHSPKQSLYPR